MTEQMKEAVTELAIRSNGIVYREERTVLPEKSESVHILTDREILELYVDNGVRTVYYETGFDVFRGTISIKREQSRRRNLYLSAVRRITYAETCF